MEKRALYEPERGALVIIREPGTWSVRVAKVNRVTAEFVFVVPSNHAADGKRTSPETRLERKRLPSPIIPYIEEVFALARDLSAQRAQIRQEADDACRPIEEHLREIFANVTPTEPRR